MFLEDEQRQRTSIEAGKLSKKKCSSEPDLNTASTEYNNVYMTNLNLMLDDDKTSSEASDSLSHMLNQNDSDEFRILYESNSNYLRENGNNYDKLDLKKKFRGKLSCDKYLIVDESIEMFDRIETKRGVAHHEPDQAHTIINQQIIRSHLVRDDSNPNLGPTLDITQTVPNRHALLITNSSCYTSSEYQDYKKLVNYMSTDEKRADCQPNDANSNGAVKNRRVKPRSYSDDLVCLKNPSKYRNVLLDDGFEDSMDGDHCLNNNMNPNEFKIVPSSSSSSVGSVPPPILSNITDVQSNQNKKQVILLK